jgi:hypothetical protein
MTTFSHYYITNYGIPACSIAEVEPWVACLVRRTSIEARPQWSLLAHEVVSYGSSANCHHLPGKRGNCRLYAQFDH